MSGIRILRNEVTGNNTADWESRIEDCGCSGGEKIWETGGARIVGNRIHNNLGVGLWADTNNTEVLVSRNLIADNFAEGNDLRDQLQRPDRPQHLPPQRLGYRPEPAGNFPTPALYLSESGSDRWLTGPTRGGLRRMADGTL